MNKNIQIVPYQQKETMSVETCIVAWIDEKQGKSGSQKTASSYQETLSQFRGVLRASGRDLDADPGIVAPLAQGWAATCDTRRRKEVAPTTYNQRLAILSSFYAYAIRHEVLAYNPIERVKRRDVRQKDAAKQIPPDTIMDGLTSINRETLEGKRNYALLAIALETGRRVSELAGMRYGHLKRQGNTCIVVFVRCKGNKQMTNVLPKNTTKALYDYLYEAYGAKLGTLAPDAPIWLSFSDRNKGQAISTRTIQRLCETYFGTSKAHATRHTWTVTMHNQKKATLAEIGRGLGHSNLKVTSDYLDELLKNENPYEAGLEDFFGIE